MTISQLMDLFEIYSLENIQSRDLKSLERQKDKQARKNANDEDPDAHLMLRTYELLDFIKKYLRRVETAINQIGIKFIQKYCIDKLGSKSIQSEHGVKATYSKSKTKKLSEEKNEVIQIRSYRKVTNFR